MREILFKGKRTDNNQWVYGHYISQDNYALIRVWNGEKFEFEEYLVDPESVSEFSGKRDRNGTRIFENDVITDGYNKDIVIYDECNYGYITKYNKVSLCEICEVVCSIYDFPKLFKGSEGE